MRIPLSKPYTGKEEEKAVIRVLRSGQLAQGPFVKRFEQDFANYVGTKFAVAVSSGTAALHVALLCLNIGKGDEVITSPFSFISTGNCILYVGAIPVFADIDPVTLNIDPSQIRKNITEKTKAVLIAHVFGLPCEMKEVIKICETHGLVLIEDCAEALGSVYDGKKAGSTGIGCFSFYPNKPITCGEGGMVSTNDREQAELVRVLRNQGRLQEEWLSHQTLGYNYRMTDLAASIGLAQLKKIDRIHAKRRSIALKYTNLLERRLGSRIALPKFSEERSWFAYVIQTDNRDGVSLRLRRYGVETRNYFPCIHLQPPYSALGFHDGQYPVAESVSKRTLALPFYTSMVEREIVYVVDSLAKALCND